MSVVYERVDISNQTLIIRTIENHPIIFKFVSYHLETKEMYKKCFFCKNLKFSPDHLKAKDVKKLLI